jgi:hypothetical protein
MLAGALVLVGGMVHADTVIGGGAIYCSPSMKADGSLEVQCENVNNGGGGDGAGGGAWEPPAPGDPAATGIEVFAATYGRNCGAQYGNQTYNIGTACDGAMSCGYVIDYRVIGDPAPGCAKDYRVSYHCAGSKITHTAYASPEAGFDKVVQLTCN